MDLNPKFVPAGVVDGKMRNWGKTKREGDAGKNKQSNQKIRKDGIVRVFGSDVIIVEFISPATTDCTHKLKNMTRMSAGAKHGCRSLQ